MVYSCFTNCLLSYSLLLRDTNTVQIYNIFYKYKTIIPKKIIFLQKEKNLGVLY